MAEELTPKIARSDKTSPRAANDGVAASHLERLSTYFAQFATSLGRLLGTGAQARFLRPSTRSASRDSGRVDPGGWVANWRTQQAAMTAMAASID